MNLIATLLFLIVGVYSGCAQLLFIPEDDFYPISDELITCPEYCPANSDPVCSSNGFCIKLFDSPCQLVYFNCKKDRLYKQIRQEYCKVSKYKNLQPKACLDGNTTST